MALNEYGDTLIENDGKGADIASQRLDDLDSRCISMARVASIECPIVVLDVGAGRCAMANALAALPSVKAIAVDPGDYNSFAEDGVTYIKRTIEQFLSSEPVPEFHLIYSQRTIHYLPFDQASAALAAAAARIQSPGYLFLSASGMGTELSLGYPAVEEPVDRRFAKLAPDMQEKHGIRQTVCLYSPDELSSLVEASGWVVVDVTVSEFGNVKLVAVAKRHIDKGAAQ
ncbi:class I SAM-dependent methyltransferase [Alcanivorax sp. 1008]|uniref:class I SAM-dependent methyltransferase n=1 Tax=Alcanivorax sp. 1008 TaxID=2816853 RepID=UPI001D746C0F|nr:methyltransferase domain-containing protein [Alcanivorax sp. 1008]MCC1496898.1 methyltransferase domain-containing protein [Alcanivorax sp. 1008]